MTAEQAAQLKEMLAAFESYVAAGGLVETLTAALAEQLGKSITGATREEILSIARTQAAELVTNITDQMKERIKQTVAEGLENQIGVDGIARALREGLTLTDGQMAQMAKYREELIKQGVPQDSDRFAELIAKKDAELIRDRAKTIAWTESAKAIEAGEKAVAEKRGATHKVWLTVSDGRVCDDCAANEAQGVIPIGDKFDTGDEHAPAHPRCRCTVSFVTIANDADQKYYDNFMEEQAADTQLIRAQGDTEPAEATA